MTIKAMLTEELNSFQMFKEQIDAYDELYERIDLIEPVVCFDSWFRVDGRPFKVTQYEDMT